MTQPVASILGLAYETSLTRFTVRTGPGTSYEKAPFNAIRDTPDLPVLDIQPDATDTKSDFGRVYQWFQLQFPDGQTGWVRGHIVGIQGDFNAYGYGFMPEMTHAYLLERDESKTGPSAEVTGEPAAPEVESAPSTVTETAAVPEVAPAAPKAAKPTFEPVAVIKTKGDAYTREGPSTVGYNRKFALPRLTPVQILAVQRENRAQHYNWYRIRYLGQEAWIREDLVRYGGDTEALGLPWDLYPAPMRDNGWWVRGFNYPPLKDDSIWEHRGWDMGANPGEPIYAGPYGGVVVQTMDCTKCTPDRPNTPSHGIRLGDPSVYSDPGWGFGYGTFVIVGYHPAKLPASTQKTLEEKGFARGSLYVLYAHLQKRMVNTGATLFPNTIIGKCGNTGNSEAPHLHLEVRMGRSDQFPGWAVLGSQNLVNPGILFNR